MTTIWDTETPENYFYKGEGKHCNDQEYKGPKILSRVSKVPSFMLLVRKFNSNTSSMGNDLFHLHINL